MKYNKVARKILVVIMILIVTLPVAVYFIANRNVVEETMKLAKIPSNYLKAESNLEFDGSLAKIIKPVNYGDWAEYKVDLNDDGSFKNDWKIFYNDGKYVYLIAAEYLKNSKIPQRAGMTTVGNYSAYWSKDSSFDGKSGMANVSTDVADQFMLSMYKNDYKYTEATDINSKATAVLLDTDVWKDFALGFPGSFAYGSPTIEMWVDSWNQKGYGNLRAGVLRESTGHLLCPYYKCNFEWEDTGYGYRAGMADGNLQENVNVSNITSGYNDELYFPYNSKLDTSDKYWIASPTYRYISQQENCAQSIAECVFGDSDIQISKSGDTKKAKDIEYGDKILYYDIELQELKEGTVEKVYVHKSAENFVKYTFEDGSYLNSTDYHPIYTKQGWKSLTYRNGYDVPKVGDEVKTVNGWKELTNIEEFSGSEDCYDFVIKGESSKAVDNYFANNTLVQSSVNYNSAEFDIQPEYAHYVHYYKDYFMDCLVSCSYNGDVSYAELDIQESNAAIRPLVVLPTNAPGYQDEDGVWILGAKPGNVIVHHYVEGTVDTKVADDEIYNNLEEGSPYTTSPLAEDKYDTDRYEYTGKTSGDPIEGEIVAGETVEVTYWYKPKKHIITTEVKGGGGHITGEGEDIYEEVVHLEDSEGDIIVRPEAGYYIKNITINGVRVNFTANEDGTYTIEKFKEMTNDIHIVVEFDKVAVDNTVSQQAIPKAGMGSSILIMIIGIIFIGTISFIKYKKIQIK